MEQTHLPLLDLMRAHIQRYNLYPGCNHLERRPVIQGPYRLHFEHVVDGQAVMNPQARLALLHYFEAFNSAPR